MATDPQKQISLHIFYARPSNDNEQTRAFEPTGEYVKFKNHKDGYFSHAYVISDDIDLSGVMAGRGRGFCSVQIEDGGDEAARELCQEIRQAHLETISVYREWRQEEGRWVNKKTVVIWGYIASANLRVGASSLGFEVHCLRHEVVNDTLGTRDYAIDCINGSSTLSGGSLGPRMPVSIAPPVETFVAENWDEPLEAQ